MKKILLVFTILLTSLKVTSIYALENNTSYNFAEHIQVLENLNRTYETGFHIYNEDEFYTNEYDKLLNTNFEEYLELISNIEPIDLYNQCLSVINTPTYVDTNIEQLVNRSTLATKTKYFNENLNKMTLKYKYSGDKFDTGYKPTATVSKVGTINYFEMSSYTGSFKNSNKTYAVVAKGKIVTYVGLVNKSFTINFNL